MDTEIECDFCHAEVRVRAVRVVLGAVQCAQCAAHSLSSRLALACLTHTSYHSEGEALGAAE